MRKKQKLNACLVLALSSSMVFTSVAAPLVPNNSMDMGMLATVDEKDHNTEAETKTATSSNAAMTEDDLEDKVLFANDESSEFSNDEFATDEFWNWYRNASMEEKEDWFLLVSSAIATSSDAKEHYPEFNLESMDFLNWYLENCMLDSDDLALDFDVIYKYVQVMDFESAIGLLDFVYNSLHADIMLMSAIGNMWPDGYGSTADFLSNGNGTEENPYVLDSVADLRGLALYVAMGQDDSDTYYRIVSGTYDLNGCWIPIGFPVNGSGSNYIAFKGHITAESGAEIINFGIGTNSNLGVDGTIVNRIKAQENIGFFGYLGTGASVENLMIETDGNTIEGTTNVGILAGKATDASIKNCTVHGYVKGTRNVGGIVGYIESSASGASVRNSVIEDCNAVDVAVYSITSDGEMGGVGGIAGYAKNTTIADVFVSTNTGSGRHIYGQNKTYTGGIVGIQKNSDIYNSTMKKGEIGGSTAYANGGIVGGYDGGQIKVARFSGTVNRPSSTNNYSACFIGTRINNAGFTYGKNGNIAYLFTDSETKANTGICGSKIIDDNNYGLNAYIGYWHSSDRKYTLVTGANTAPSDDYFYQVLEKGILSIMETGRTADIVINHFSADAQGNPVRGYLLSINEPRVGGTVAAKITAQIQGGFKPVVTAENLGAYQAGDRVYVSFVNQSNGNVQFRLDPDRSPNPYYTYQKYGEFGIVSGEEDGLYSDGGYWLTMPESDTVISAHYKAAAKSITLNPSKVTLEVTQERSGDRDHATVKWYATAKNENGTVITDGNGNVWNRLELKTDGTNPEFYIDSLINGLANNTFNLVWSTNNTGSANVINNALGANGAADKKAKFTINIADSKMVEKTNELRAQQSADGNRNSLTTNSPYRYHALITGTAQSGDGIDANDPPKGFLDIDINFNIIDRTNVSVNGVALSKNTITYDVVRTLSGDRANPTETYTINGQAAGNDNNTISALTATFDPDYFSNDKVKWYLSTPGQGDIFEDVQHVAVENDENNTDDGTLNVVVSGTGDKAYYNASVTLKGLTTTSCTNAVLAPVVNDQNFTYTNEMKTVPETVTTYEKYVKVTAKDTNTNSVTDTCKVVVNFHTEDNTEIMPTNVAIDNASNIGGYKIHYTFESDKDSTITSRVITRENDVSVTPLINGKGQTLTATVSPEKDSARPEYQPYDDTVVWSLANPLTGSGSNLNVNDILAIDPNSGQITVRGFNSANEATDLGYSPWIQSLISGNRLEGTTVPVRIMATSNRDGSLVDYKDINITFVGTAIDSEVSAGVTFDAVLTKEIGTSLSGTSIVSSSSWTGTDGKALDATITGTDETPQFTIYDENGVAISTGVATIGDSRLRSVTTNKYINLVKDADWIQSVIDNRASGNKDTQKLIVKAKTTNGTSVKEIPVTINFRYDGVDMSASTISELPNGYTASPEVITSSTPGDTYDVAKASVKDRIVTLNVVATQGNYSVNNPETRKWSYGIVKLDDTTYTKDGVKTGDVVYELTGDLANYAKVDTHGYLVPIKGYWEDVIGAGQVKGTVSGVVTAKKDDGKVMTDSYKVNIDFRYDKAVLESHEETFDLGCVQNTLNNGPQETWSGKTSTKLVAHIYDESGKDVTPKWESSDPSIVSVDADGNISVNKDTWMRELIESAKVYGNKVHTGSKVITITAKHPVTGATADSCQVTVNFNYENVVLSEHNKVLDVTLTATGTRSNPRYTWEGHQIDLDAMLHSLNPMEKDVVFTSLNDDIFIVDENGVVTVNPDSEWLTKLKITSPYTGTATGIIQVASKDGRVSDQSNLTLNLTYVNRTTSGGSGGSGGGGGGGGSTSGSSPGGSKQSTATGLPSYVVKGGTWTQNALGQWFYSNARTYTNEWAAVHNPYADVTKGQSQFDWFYFGKDSVMATGWFVDESGDTYFLHNTSDNTLGHMYTGWHWIKGADGIERCYYFNPVSDGHRGRLYKNTTTPDGYLVNADGAWMVNGVVITR